MTHSLLFHVAEIERHLRTFYPLNIEVSAKDYILSPNFSHDSIENKRAAVVSIECDGYQNIGIYFSQAFIDQHAEATPKNLITTKSLDSHCAIIEEVSHFHLLAHRTLCDQPVTRLELETQAEIDKFLICATMLFEQTGDSHFQSLARCIYDQSTITDLEHQSIYWNATRFAAKFWHEQIRHLNAKADLRYLRDIRQTLHHLFVSSFQEKVQQLSARSRTSTAA
jgi:hypothetical protein